MTDNNIDRYYDAFLHYLDAVGYHQAILKMKENRDDEVLKVETIAAKYGYNDSNIDEKVIKRDETRWSSLKALNHWSVKVGFKPMNEEGMKKFLKFCEDSGRREYLRRRVRRLKDQAKLMPINELMLAKFKLEKKRRDKDGLA